MSIDQEPYIAECFVTDSDLNEMLGEIMDDYQKGNTKDANKKWQKANPKYQKALKPCTKNSVEDDFNKLQKFEQDVLNRKDAKTYIAGRMKKYQSFISKLSDEMMKEWSIGDYRNAGMYNGQIAQYLGVAPNPYYDEEPEYKDP